MAIYNRTIRKHRRSVPNQHRSYGEKRNRDEKINYLQYFEDEEDEYS